MGSKHAKRRTILFVFVRFDWKNEMNPRKRPDEPDEKIRLINKSSRSKFEVSGQIGSGCEKDVKKSLPNVTGSDQQNRIMQIRRTSAIFLNVTL